MATSIASFDYLALKVQSKPYLFVMSSTLPDLDLRVDGFLIDESSQPPKFVATQMDYKELTDAFKTGVFDDLRNFRYLKVVHHPTDLEPNAVDFIVDGNDAKFFALSGLFTPTLSGQGILKLGFQISL